MLVLWSRKDTYRGRFINCLANPLYTVSDHCLASGLVLSSFAQSLYYVAIYITISTPAFRVPPLLLLMTIGNAHKK